MKEVHGSLECTSISGHRRNPQSGRTDPCGTQDGLKWRGQWRQDGLRLLIGGADLRRGVVRGAPLPLLSGYRQRLLYTALLWCSMAGSPGAGSAPHPTLCLPAPHPTLLCLCSSLLCRDGTALSLGHVSKPPPLRASVSRTPLPPPSLSHSLSRALSFSLTLLSFCSLALSLSLCSFS